MTLGNFKYAYSFDGINYKGNFNARSQARREALAEIEAAGEKDTTFFCWQNYKRALPSC